MIKNDNETVKKMLTHPYSGKKVKDVMTNDGRWWRWNSVYKVYNCVDNYQLQRSQVSLLVWEV